MRILTRSLSLALALSLSLAALGCKEDANVRTERAPAVPSAAATKQAHAPANVVPGSHDDWCAEHGVPESQCTRCDSELIAAFKATGDWCEEHGLPESQCLKCNPSLKIVRPPKGEGK